MANVVILGVYASKAALDAGAEDPSNGDTYIVGSKCPYDLYTYSSSKSAFQKGEQVGRVSDLTITIDDVTADITVAKVMGKTLKDANGNNVKIIEAVGKDLGLYEIAGA